MAKDDKNNSSEPEEDETNYKHAASEIEALRAILKKRKNDEDDKDANENNTEKPE